MKVELKGGTCSKSYQVESAKASGKGKTAPRLLYDLVLYDPRRLPASGYNILTDIPLPYEEGKAPPPQLASDSCRHVWILKDNQCRLLEKGRKPHPHAVYTAAACCTACRSHLEVSIDFRWEEDELLSCPNKDMPLHHFLFKANLSHSRQPVKNGWKFGASSEWVDAQRFQCSSPRCSAKLLVQFRPPRMINDWVRLLTDPSAIKARAEKAMLEEPERLEGHAIPAPVEVLTNLRHYIGNAMNSIEGRRRIPGNNKKWLLCLGEQCSELLQYLGFTRLVTLRPWPKKVLKTDSRLRSKTGCHPALSRRLSFLFKTP